MEENKITMKVIIELIVYIVVVLTILTAFVIPMLNKQKLYAEIITYPENSNPNRIKLLIKDQNVELTKDNTAICKFEANVYDPYIERIHFFIRPRTETHNYLQDSGYVVRRLFDQQLYVNETYTLGSKSFPIRSSETYDYQIRSGNEILETGKITANVFQFRNNLNNVLYYLGIILGFLGSMIKLIQLMHPIIQKLGSKEEKGERHDNYNQ